MSIVPDSAHLMGLNPPLKPEQSAYRMILHKGVGALLGGYFREGAGKDLLQKMYPDPSSPKPALSVHPGGPNILGSVTEVLLELG